MANFYSIYFTHNGQVVRLPHNPSELPDTQDASNGEYNVLGLGPVMVPRTPNQRKISISNYFPGHVSASLTSLLSYRAPEYYIEFFRQAMESGNPVLYTPVRINEMGVPYAMSLTGYYVLVTRFDYREKGGETGDFYYDLECVEWRDYSPRRVQVVQDTAQGTASTASAAQSAAVSALARTVTQTAAAAVSGAASGALAASLEPSRRTPSRQLVVGSLCTLDGAYYQSPDGSGPQTPAAGLQVTVSRIEAGTRRAPVYVKDTAGRALGWTGKEMLRVVSNAAKN